MACVYKTSIEKNIDFLIFESKTIELRKYGLHQKRNTKPDSEVRCLRMRIENWMQLIHYSPQVEAVMKEMANGTAVDVTENIGLNTVLTIKAPYRTIDIRRKYYYKSGEYFSKEGVTLHMNGWRKLLQQHEEVQEVWRQFSRKVKTKSSR